MKKVLTAVLGLVLVLTLSACKLEHNSKVKYTQLTGGVTTIEAMAKVEVPNCHDLRDKTKPSEYIGKTTSIMKKLFPDVVFEECKREGIHSIMTFTVPMEVGTLPPDFKSEPNPKSIALIRNIQGETFLCIAKPIRDTIVEARKQEILSGIELNVNVRLINNTDKPLVIHPKSVFVDGHPFCGLERWTNSQKIPAGEHVIIKLSDVSSEYAIENGVTALFVEEGQQAGAK